MKFKIQILVILIVAGIICPVTSFSQEECDPFVDVFCEPVPLDDGVILLLVGSMILWYRIGMQQFKSNRRINA